MASFAPDRRSAQPLTSTGTLPETYTSLPNALLDPAQAGERGLDVVPSGLWLIENSRPLDKADLDNAREIATRHGFRIETRDDRSNLRMIRLAAGLAGMLLALGVMAATLGLIRGESANDVRTLDSGRGAADRRGAGSPPSPPAHWRASARCSASSAPTSDSPPAASTI